MPDLIRAKIDLAKIRGAKIIKKDGRTFVEVTDAGLFAGRAGALYLDFAAFPTPGHEFGDWRLTQDLPKALRDAGERGPILGNGKNKPFAGKSGATPAQNPAPSPAPGAVEDEDMPF